MSEEEDSDNNNPETDLPSEHDNFNEACIIDESDGESLENAHQTYHDEVPIIAPSVLASLMVSHSFKITKNGKSADKKPRMIGLERHSARVRDFERLVQYPIVIEVFVNGYTVNALVDSSSLADFVSTKLVDQLKIPISTLNKPLPVQLATAIGNMISKTFLVEKALGLTRRPSWDDLLQNILHVFHVFPVGAAESSSTLVGRGAESATNFGGGE